MRIFFASKLIAHAGRHRTLKGKGTWLSMRHHQCFSPSPAIAVATHSMSVGLISIIVAPTVGFCLSGMHQVHMSGNVGHRNRIHPNLSQKIKWGEYRGMLVGSSSNKYIKSQILLGAVRHCCCEHICKWNEGCNPKIRSCSIQRRLFADLVGIQNSI